MIASTDIENYQNKDDAKEKSGGGGINVPLVASIVACVLIIVIASVFIVYRKKKANRNKQNNKSEDEKAGFFGGQNRRLTSPRKDRSSVQEKMMFQQGLPGQRDSPIDCGYLSGGEPIFIPTNPNQQPTYVTAFPGNGPAFVPGQQYINWPMPGGYAQQPHMANMYPYKQSVEQINPTGVYYPKSGGEG